MRLKRVRRVRVVAVSVAATVALSVAASPAGAQAPIPVGSMADGHAYAGERNGVERQAGRFRGRYQLRLPEARTRATATQH
jgi:hypothetical protein